MATTTGLQQKIEPLIISLIELNYDAVQAYEAAIERLESVDVCERMGAFLEDHNRHIVELKDYAKSLNAKIPDGPDMKAVLTKGKVALGALVSDDTILRAMLSDERDTNKAYERAVDRDDLSDPLRDMLTRHKSDESRHRHYLCKRLGEEDEGEQQHKEDEIRRGPEPRIHAPPQPIGQTTDV